MIKRMALVLVFLFLIDVNLVDGGVLDTFKDIKNMLPDIRCAVRCQRVRVYTGLHGSKWETMLAHFQCELGFFCFPPSLRLNPLRAVSSGSDRESGSELSYRVSHVHVVGGLLQP